MLVGRFVFSDVVGAYGRTAKNWCHVAILSGALYCHALRQKDLRDLSTWGAVTSLDFVLEKVTHIFLRGNPHIFFFSPSDIICRKV